MPPSPPDPSASRPVTPIWALLAETAAGACDCLALVTEVCHRRRCFVCAELTMSWGPAAVRRAIAAALHRSSGVFTDGLLALALTLKPIL